MGLRLLKISILLENPGLRRLPSTIRMVRPTVHCAKRSAWLALLLFRFWRLFSRFFLQLCMCRLAHSPFTWRVLSATGIRAADRLSIHCSEAHSGALAPCASWRADGAPDVFAVRGGVI